MRAWVTSWDFKLLRNTYTDLTVKLERKGNFGPLLLGCGSRLPLKIENDINLSPTWL
jgi:hypothetical protein